MHREIETTSTTTVSGALEWLSKDPIGISGGLNQYVFCGNNPVNFVDPYGLDADSPFAQFFHTGHLINLTGESVLVSGNNPNGPGQLQCEVPPWTIFPDTPFANNDIDAVYYGDQTIKLRGILGSWIHLPGWLRPDDYDSGWGDFLRLWGLFNPLVDPEEEFGPIQPPMLPETPYDDECGGK